MDPPSTQQQPPDHMVKGFIKPETILPIVNFCVATALKDRLNELNLTEFQSGEFRSLLDYLKSLAELQVADKLTQLSVSVERLQSELAIKSTAIENLQSQMVLRLESVEKTQSDLDSRTESVEATLNEFTSTRRVQDNDVLSRIENVETCQKELQSSVIDVTCCNNELASKLSVLEQSHGCSDTLPAERKHEAQENVGGSNKTSEEMKRENYECLASGNKEALLSLRSEFNEQATALQRRIDNVACEASVFRDSLNNINKQNGNELQMLRSDFENQVKTLQRRADNVDGSISKFDDSLHNSIEKSGQELLGLRSDLQEQLEVLRHRVDDVASLMHASAKADLPKHFSVHNTQDGNQLQDTINQQQVLREQQAKINKDYEQILITQTAVKGMQEKILLEQNELRVQFTCQTNNIPEQVKTCVTDMGLLRKCEELSADYNEIQKRLSSQVTNPEEMQSKIMKSVQNTGVFERLEKSISDQNDFREKVCYKNDVLQEVKLALDSLGITAHVHTVAAGRNEFRDNLVSRTDLSAEVERAVTQIGIHEELEKVAKEQSVLRDGFANITKDYKYNSISEARRAVESMGISETLRQLTDKHVEFLDKANCHEEVKKAIEQMGITRTLEKVLAEQNIYREKPSLNEVRVEAKSVVDSLGVLQKIDRMSKDQTELTQKLASIRTEISAAIKNAGILSTLEEVSKSQEKIENEQYKINKKFDVILPKEGNNAVLKQQVDKILLDQRNIVTQEQLRQHHEDVSKRHKTLSSDLALLQESQARILTQFHSLSVLPAEVRKVIEDKINMKKDFETVKFELRSLQNLKVKTIAEQVAEREKIAQQLEEHSTRCQRVSEELTEIIDCKQKLVSSELAANAQACETLLNLHKKMADDQEKLRGDLNIYRSDLKRLSRDLTQHSIDRKRLDTQVQQVAKEKEKMSGDIRALKYVVENWIPSTADNNAAALVPYSANAFPRNSTIVLPLDPNSALRAIEYSNGSTSNNDFTPYSEESQLGFQDTAAEIVDNDYRCAMEMFEDDDIVEAEDAENDFSSTYEAASTTPRALALKRSGEKRMEDLTRVTYHHHQNAATASISSEPVLIGQWTKASEQVSVDEDSQEPLLLVDTESMEQIYNQQSGGPPPRKQRRKQIL